MFNFIAFWNEYKNCVYVYTTPFHTRKIKISLFISSPLFSNIFNPFCIFYGSSMLVFFVLYMFLCFILRKLLFFSWKLHRNHLSVNEGMGHEMLKIQSRKGCVCTVSWLAIFSISIPISCRKTNESTILNWNSMPIWYGDDDDENCIRKKTSPTTESFIIIVIV